MDKLIKEKLKTLESDIKSAFKENRFEQVVKLANDIKVIDPENHLASKLLDKVKDAKAKAKAKENAVKIKDYQNMLVKMFKEGNLANVRKLAEELKEFDPKASEEWVKKAADEEAKVKHKQNAAKIKEIEKQLNSAFKETRFEEVKTLADKLKELDPKNKEGEKFVAKIEKAKADAKRRENADKINALQDQIKLAFKESRFEELGKIANKLFEIDPGNKFAKKYLDKSVKIQAKTKKKEVAPVKVEKTKKKGEGFFAKLFKKKEKTEAKPAEPIKPAPVATKSVIAEKAPLKEPIPAAPITPAKPVMEAKPAAPVPSASAAAPVAPVAPKAPVAPAKPEELKLKVAEPAVLAPKKAEAEQEEKGNIFTKMFGKKVEPEKAQKSIIDTIVAKTEEKKAKVKEPKKEKQPGLAFAGFSSAFLKFAVAFIIITAGFFYVQNIDANNTVLGLIGAEDNYASQLHAASESLSERQIEEKGLNSEVNRYKEGYDNEYEKTVEAIIEKRMNWPDVMTKIDEIANAVYERNEISQYIKFNSFSFDANTGQIRVNGTLSDPLGKNLTKLVELEQTFRYFPRDINNPNDPTKPYFYDVQEFKSLSKSYDSRTGKYTSTFQISFLLEEPTEQ